MKDENKDLQEIATIAADPTWKAVKLAGTKISPQANMMVYWHKQGQHVMVDNTKMWPLPQNDAAHQYQLWAIVDGKPVDLGVFDATAEPKKLLVAMKEVGNAQAFAVTLEKRGGSISPTMEKNGCYGWRIYLINPFSTSGICSATADAFTETFDTASWSPDNPCK